MEQQFLVFFFCESKYYDLVLFYLPPHPTPCREKNILRRYEAFAAAARRRVNKFAQFAARGNEIFSDV